MNILLYLIISLFSTQTDADIKESRAAQNIEQHQLNRSVGRITFKAKEGATVDGGD